MAITKELLEQALQETRTGPDYCAKCVQTRNGHSVRILAVDDEGDLPIIAQIKTNGIWTVVFRGVSGNFKDNSQSSDDLVAAPRTYTCWVRFFEYEHDKARLFSQFPDDLSDGGMFWPNFHWLTDPVQVTAQAKENET